MTVRIGNIEAEIKGYDRIKLNRMAAAVLEDRPSFRAIRGKIGTEPVSIYTRCKQTATAAFTPEELVVRAQSSTFSLKPQDKNELQALLAATDWEQA